MRIKIRLLPWQQVVYSCFKHGEARSYLAVKEHHTSYTCSSVCRYVGVHCDLWVQNAAVGVGVHLQRVQQLPVVLHSVVICAALFWNQLGNALWRQTGH